MRWCAGEALNKLGMEQQGTDMDVVHLAGEGVQCAPPKIFPVLTDGGQGREGIAAERNIVKTQDADILGNPKAKLIAVDHNAVRQNIMAADDGGAALL